jgi:hypothetical protein
MRRCKPLREQAGEHPLPQSGSPSADALDGVAREINELERLCGEINAALDERNWARLAGAIADSRRVTHAMENAMADAMPYRDARFNQAVFARLQRIFSYRQERMRELEAFHHEVAEKLKQISRWKVYARSLGSREPIKRTTGLNQLR